MKFKPAQLICGISALAFFLSNFLYVVNWIVEDYGVPMLSFGFLTWPISFVIELAALVVFTLFFKNIVIRNIAGGVFIAARLLYALYFMNVDGSSISYMLKLFIGWPYWGSFGLTFFAAILDLISFVAFIVAWIISFANLAQVPTSPAGTSFNSPAATPAYFQPPRTKNVQGRYSDIEVLGDLLAKGLLTQEEFDHKKREILGIDR